jgi:hypothetical protein
MEEVIDQVMRTYGMMVNLTPEEEQSARLRLTDFLKGQERRRSYVSPWRPTVARTASQVLIARLDCLSHK